MSWIPAIFKVISQQNWCNSHISFAVGYFRISGVYCCDFCSSLQHFILFCWITTNHFSIAAVSQHSVIALLHLLQLNITNSLLLPSQTKICWRRSWPTATFTVLSKWWVCYDWHLPFYVDIMIDFDVLMWYVSLCLCSARWPHGSCGGHTLWSPGQEVPDQRAN